VRLWRIIITITISSGMKRILVYIVLALFGISCCGGNGASKEASKQDIEEITDAAADAIESGSKHLAGWIENAGEAISDGAKDIVKNSDKYLEQAKDGAEKACDKVEEVYELAKNKIGESR
jgi:hypothetical protein